MPQIAIAAAITVGGMAVQYLMAPKVKGQKEDKGKMDDIRIQGSDYGAFIPRLLSGECRIAGNLIASTGIVTHINTTGGGGGGGKKSGGGNTVTEYTYTTTVGILFLNSQISTIGRVWDDQNLLVNNSVGASALIEAEGAVHVTRVGGTISSSGSGWTGTGYVTNLGSGNKCTFDLSWVTNPTRPRDVQILYDAKTHLSFKYKCTSDKLVTITAGADVRTITLENTDGAWAQYDYDVLTFVTSVVYEYPSAGTADLDSFWFEKYWAPVEENAQWLIPYGVTGVVDPNVIYPLNLDNPSQYYNYQVSEVTDGATGISTLDLPAPPVSMVVYTGTETQTQDPRLVTWQDTLYGTGEGALRVSAMRGMTYIMLYDYLMRQNNVGNISAEFYKGTDTLNEALEILLEDVGLTSGYYDLTATAAITQRGILETTKRSRKAWFEDLERYHQFRIGEIDGKIYTILDSTSSVGTISATNLRAVGEGQSQMEYDVEVEIEEEHLLPRQTLVSFQNPELEFHNDTVRSPLFGSSVVNETVEYNFPIIDDADQARNRAEKLQLKRWAESTRYLHHAMPSEFKYAIGDVITVPVNGVNTLMRIEKKVMALPMGAVQFHCISVSPYSITYYQADVTELAPKGLSQYASSTFPRNSIVVAIPSVPVRTRDKGKLGVYLGVCHRGVGHGQKIILHRETDTDNYVPQQVITTPSLVALCDGTLGNWASGTSVIDTSNYLDLWFFNDVTLESITDSDISRLPQNNLIRIGDEWVVFKTAAAQTLEDNSPYRSKWRISNLWRGRFGTSSEISAHAAGEYATIGDLNMIFYELEEEDIGQTVNLKAVTEGQAVDVAPITSFTFAEATNWNVTNYNTSRTFDADDISIDELADVVATIVKEDLHL